MIPINAAENISKVIIKSAKSVFENKIENIVVLKLTNDLYKSFHIIFILYNYFPIFLFMIEDTFVVTSITELQKFL